MSPRNDTNDGGPRHESEADEALLDKTMAEHHAPEPSSQTGFVRASFWIVVNTLATIGIVCIISLPQGPKQRCV